MSSELLEGEGRAVRSAVTQASLCPVHSGGTENGLHAEQRDSVERYQTEGRAGEGTLRKGRKPMKRGPGPHGSAESSKVSQKARARHSRQGINEEDSPAPGRAGAERWARWERTRRQAQPQSCGQDSSRAWAPRPAQLPFLSQSLGHCPQNCRASR